MLTVTNKAVAVLAGCGKSRRNTISPKSKHHYDHANASWINVIRGQNPFFRSLLKAAKATQGAPPDAGIRIVQGAVPDDSEKPALAVGFTISDDPAPNDEELKQNGLRIFVEDALVEPLDGRTLDVRDADEGPELVFR